MQVIETALDAVELGSPVQFENLQIYPLLGHNGSDADYLTLDEALDRGLAEVSEVSGAGHVPELRFENRCTDPILLVEGEELVGARRNCVLNLSILVGAMKNIVVPVSCVEQGRWSDGSRNLACAGRNLHAHAGAEKSDALEAYPRALCAAERQVGAVFAIRGDVRALELFDSPATFAKFMPNLVRSHALDAIENGDESAARSREQERVIHNDGSQLGRKVATRLMVKRFLDQIRRANGVRARGVDEGEDVRIETRRIAGGALVKGDRVIHLAAFNVERALS